MEITVTLTSISLNLSHLAVVKIDSTSFQHTVGDSLAVIVSSLTVSNELFTVFTICLRFFLRTFFFFAPFGNTLHLNWCMHGKYFSYLFHLMCNQVVYKLMCHF